MEVMVRSSGLQGIITLLESFSIDAIALSERNGVKKSELMSSDSLIPLKSVTAILEESAQITKCDFFGLELSKFQDIEVLGPNAMVNKNAKTIRDALRLATKYMHIHSPGIVFTVFELSSFVSVSVDLSLSVDSESQSECKQCLELCLADLHKILKFIIGESYHPIAVAFTHSKLSNKYRTVFGSKIIFDHFRTGIHLSPEILDAPIKLRSEAYLKIAEDYIKNNYQLKNDEIDVKVEKMLYSFLGTEQAGKEHICEALAIHPRTLQRKLAKKGTKFEEIKEQVRKKVLFGYLTKTNTELQKLTEIIGFSELSSMSRACKKWFGKTPSELRQAYVIE